jgi:hypothetical protein
MLRSALITMFLILFNLIGGHAAMAIEEPKYQLLEKDDNFEVRLYEPMIVAETWIDGSLDEASSRGFRLIAAYIFGGNSSKQGESEKIAMTAPVSMVPSAEKIAMTAPVTMEQKENRYRMHFVMPASYTMDTLPTPNNAKVTLRQIPAQKAAVLQFSWLAGEDKVAAQTTLLQQWLQSRGLEATSSPQLARYNPPWTLPFLRRNEIMINVK